ncbi:hypothetical protein ACIBG8_02615 [Nonomuraea sp. NPDC050556]|uniref:hypothetical protein n=1 Tax=Nonomuraea sp. NPDC050556 TaxID=3364369 RepID=UPI0037AFC2C1
MFDLSGPWGRVLAGTRLHHGPAMQSLAVDPATHDLFVIQLRDRDTAPDEGNLCVNRVDRRTGLVRDWMHLDGFGHGYQIGAQHLAGRTHLWSEAGPVRKGFGTRVTRFPFLPGQSIDMGASVLLAPFSPVPGTLVCAPTVDPVGNWLTIRYRTTAGHFYARYAIDPATGKPAAAPAATIAHPEEVAGTFQGFATLGDLLYLYTGDPSDSYETSNTRISTVSWADPGAAPRITRITALPGLPWREPEGLALESVGGRVQLLFGLNGDADRGRVASVCVYTSDPPVQGVKVVAGWSPITPADGVTPHTDQRVPRARLVSIGGTTQLQLRGSLGCDLAADGPIGTLPPWLTPSRPVRATVPRNMTYGVAACEVEANAAGELWAYGATASSRVSWIDLDCFAAPWA